ncbi:hypothetical protein KFE25_004426 [Diacronema lutheri]|uniref:Uncharacterized protein n=1 Tax=Diacronema lutheri TaxID=2081491 RepID=A0A8J6CA69_DIALT|nr:hypothetical protein KFE25_004426 [Diacronema lutheri]
MSNQLIVFPVTCFFFFVEALVHYHIGKTGSAFGLSWPPPDELAKIVVSIIICGALSSLATSAIEGMLATRARGAKAKAQ